MGLSGPQFIMKALAIFGSTARHEREASSDIDLIGLYDEVTVRSITEQSVSLFMYPEKKLVEMMTNGDLFALHLVKEAQPIYGSDIFELIFSKFNYKENYKQEMNVSMYVANYILKNYEMLNDYSEANKKLSWSLRTFIIAVSAHDRNPVFSKVKIAEYLSFPNLTSQDVLAAINVKIFKSKLPTDMLMKIKSIFIYLAESNPSGRRHEMDIVLASSIIKKIGIDYSGLFAGGR